MEIEKDEYFIIVDSSLNSSYYRQQFSLAHELGHYLFDSGSYDENELDSLEVQIMENRANNFASELLLPEKKIREDFQTINVEKIDEFILNKNFEDAKGEKLFTATIKFHNVLKIFLGVLLVLGFIFIVFFLYLNKLNKEDKKNIDKMLLEKYRNIKPLSKNYNNKE